MRKGMDKRRILVTGSRGKSSVVRLLHAGLNAGGVATWSKITGVVPRELTPSGERVIMRTAGAHVEEMRWWLKVLPPEAEGVVLENSAVAPELQHLAARWLQPDVTVFTNTYPDHQEVWGPSSAGAAAALIEGIRPGSRVVLPESMAGENAVIVRLQRKRCQLHFAEPVEFEGLELYQRQNMGLAQKTLQFLGIPMTESQRAMLALAPDCCDFRVVRCGEVEFACAFTANDVASTEALFSALPWERETTSLVFNHRRDRPGRFAAFLDWMKSGWQQVVVIGDSPGRNIPGSRYIPLKKGGLQHLLTAGGKEAQRFFGCGNVAGFPLQFMALEKRYFEDVQ